MFFSEAKKGKLPETPIFKYDVYLYQSLISVVRGACGETSFLVYVTK